MKTDLHKWIDSLALFDVPQEIAAFCFNLYDDCDDESWSMELVGTSRFDENDSDWACDELTDFGSRQQEYRWKRNAKWDVVLDEIVNELLAYLQNGTYSKVLKSRNGVAVGFTDGDLEILHKK